MEGGNHDEAVSSDLRAGRAGGRFCRLFRHLRRHRRPQAVEPGQAGELRVRHRADADAAARGQDPGQVLPDRDVVHRVRHRDHLPVSLGGRLQQARRLRPGRDGDVRHHCACRVRVHLAARRPGVGLAMGLEEKLPSGVLLTSVEKAAGWARARSVWPATFGLACCAIELFQTGGPKHDLARFGMERASNTPRQADLMIVAGRVSQKMAPVLRQIYDQMSEPKWVIAMGVCASSGGMFNNYAIVQGVDHIVPVDIYLPGCPPRPEMLLDAILKLHDKIQNMKLGVNRQNEITELEQARLRRLPLVPSLRDSVPGSTGPATTVSASTVSATTVSSTTGQNGTGAPGMGHDR